MREDVIREESELSALKAEKDELEQALMRDREDVRDMKKRMNDVQTETKSLKEQLEKLRKEARQQKGLVAISKKQLATAEAEQDTTASEIEAVQRGEVEQQAAGEHNAHAAFAVPTHTAAGESVTSPAASVRSTNPFDRFGAGASTSQPGTPTLGGSHHPSTGASLAAGAGAGAVLGGVVAATTHHGEGSHAVTPGTDAHEADYSHQDSRDADAFGLPQSDQQQQPQHHEAQSLGFDDAFAVPGEPTAASTGGQGHTRAASTDFDDNFGDDFGASATTVPTSSSAVPSATSLDAAPHAGADHHNAGLAAAGGVGTAAIGTGAVYAAQSSHGADADTEPKADDSLDGPFGGNATATLT